MSSLGLLELQAAAWEVNLDSRSCERLLGFARLLAAYDRANVIGTRDLDGILLSHVLDSLSCFMYEPLFRARRLADVGSGGGLPGIPINVVRQDLGTTLIESTGKKAAFIRYAAEHLGLEGVQVANERAEDLGRAGEHRGAYDIVTCRAVAGLSVVAEYCVPLLEIGGRVIAMKGRLGPEELSEASSAAEALGAMVAEKKRVPMLPEVGQKERNLVIIQKTGETPVRYPRRAGVVAKKPLGS
ncbi:MAG: 16S rRNA (guanine(527)-N(7))-methyltransferase RsmG [Rubrobacter sp.]|nr:16S rRNA (guanine(527)-N(7))-methyltransferase RsmG [Rubrobacter sp.]